ncbi:MAG: type III-A CRISPR-associated protein Cas10/Csm1, partial [Nitrospiraceae bacterium]|nr:type III-A CRISPR-associated protein Cas10/Csm1 [Nitrospiraceae bacterium]
MDRESYLNLKLGALFHDIGKVVQRSTGKIEGTHSEQGFAFLNSFSNFKNIALFARYHHRDAMDKLISENLDQETNNLIWMVYESDNLSASERGDFHGEFITERPLTTIFSSISGIKDEVPDVKQMVYPLGAKLDMSTFVFPGYAKDSYDIASHDYRDLYDIFKKTLPIGENWVNEDLLLMFLEENTSFVPARTTEDEDISLFDHLKTTCAIACCMYKYHELELDQPLQNRIENRDNAKYLLIGGDVSGIQKFIYHVSSKGALKLLRGRSFYLEIFCENVVYNIVKELDLPKANVLYSGGGHFFILAPNTDEANEKLQKIQEKLNNWMIETGLSSALYLAMSWIPFTGNEFKNFGDMWHKIYKELSSEKSRKYSAILETSPKRLLMRDGGGAYCDACRRIVPDGELEPIEEESDVKFCRLCHQQYNLGKKLAKFGKSFYIVQSGSGADSDISLPFDNLKVIENDKLHELSDTTMIYSINSWSTRQIRNLIESGNLDVNVGVVALPVAVYCASEGGELLDLDQLAEHASGSKKIGALRMDVDNLGRIFARGLPEAKRSISQISNLSRFMNYFFKVYLNMFGEFKENNILGICNNHHPENLRLGRRRNHNRNFNIIYAGGDDLFIIGSWDDVLELAFDIEAVFRKYVGGNDDITISAGYSIFDSKHPLYQIANICEKKEKCAKEEDKNRIYLLDRGIEKGKLAGATESIEWDRARELFQDFKPLFSEVFGEDDEVSKGMIRTLLSARAEYCANP